MGFEKYGEETGQGPRHQLKMTGVQSSLKFHDRFRVRDWLRFLGSFLVFFVPAFWGMKTGGFAGVSVAWVVGSGLIFGFWFPAILCRHCPHYARKGMILICPSTVGPLKIRPYVPGPVSAIEKIQMAVGLVLVLGFPFPFLVIGRQWLFLLLALGGLCVFFISEQLFSCSKCLNFSCPLNRVPEEFRRRPGPRALPGGQLPPYSPVVTSHGRVASRRLVP